MGKSRTKIQVNVNSILDRCVAYSDEYMPSHVPESDVLILLMVFNLHNEGVVVKESLLEMCKQYRNGTLSRGLNTYHCRVTDKWYNDSSTYQVWLYAYKSRSVYRQLDFDTLISYVNLLLNKNRNYCIDWIYDNVFSRIIDTANFYEGTIAFRNLKFNVEFNTFESVEHLLGSGYCCEDCDGCYTQYKRRQFKSAYQTQDLDKKVKAILFQTKNRSWKSQ